MLTLPGYMIGHDSGVMEGDLLEFRCLSWLSSSFIPPHDMDSPIVYYLRYPAYLSFFERLNRVRRWLQA